MKNNEERSTDQSLSEYSDDDSSSGLFDDVRKTWIPEDPNYDPEKKILEEKMRKNKLH